MMAQEKPKLCFVVPEYRSDSSTHFSYIYDMVRELSSVFQIRCVIERSFGNPMLPEGVEVYAQQSGWFLFCIVQTKINILRARLVGYRVFYIHYSFFSAFFASLLVRIFGGRVFYWNCGLPWQYRRNWFRERFERLVYRIITFLVTGTEGLKKEYAKHYDMPLEKIKVLPNWIDVNKWRVASGELLVEEKKQQLKRKLNIPRSTKVLLFVHRLSKRKGAHYIPEILKRLRDENIVMIVIGDGPERDHLKLEIGNWKLADKVRLLGRIPQNEVIKYLAIADIFIMPSEEEGFPHVLLETMAAGIPFVAFDVGGVTEIAPPELQEYILPLDHFALFISKIQYLLRSHDHNTRIADVEKMWVARFDTEEIARRFINLITNEI